ncbi:MAG: DUF1566 domain-containing protein [Rhodocyclaceae bacterium]|nr:MAG: DUF1566 domain-containing protein [Rhodocyclaceae bacterium]
MKRHMIFAFLLAAVGSSAATADTYDAATGRVTIDSIQVGDTTYTNVVVTIGSVISVGGSTQVLPAGYVSQGGLTWSPPNGFLMGYSQANTYCKNTTLNGSTGWRLPTLLELSGLATPPSGLTTPSTATSATGGLYASGALNGKGWTAWYVWSSTPTTAPADNFPGYWGVFLGDSQDPTSPFHAGNVVNSAPPDTGFTTCVR